MSPAKIRVPNRKNRLVSPKFGSLRSPNAPWGHTGLRPLVRVLRTQMCPYSHPCQQERVSQSTDDIEVDLEGTPNASFLTGKWREDPECGLPHYAAPDDE